MRRMQAFIIALFVSLLLTSSLSAEDPKTDDAPHWTVEKVRKDFAVLDLSDAQAKQVAAWFNKHDMSKPDAAGMAHLFDEMLSDPLQRVVFQYVIDRGGDAAKPLPKSGEEYAFFWQAGDWTYSLPGFDRKRGRLFYGKREVPNAALSGQYYDTPGGKIVWSGAAVPLVGGRGWLPEKEFEASGKKLNPPPLQDVLISAADAGKTRQAEPGQLIAIDLKGNPTTGYGWVLESLEGEAVVQVGGIKFVEAAKNIPPAEAGEQRIVGAGGIFHATFEAGKEGKATVKMVYRRPWEKDKDPAETFSVMIEVVAGKQAPEGPAAAAVLDINVVDSKATYTLASKTYTDLEKLLAALKAMKADGVGQLLLNPGADAPKAAIADAVNVGRAAGFSEIGMQGKAPEKPVASGE